MKKIQQRTIQQTIDDILANPGKAIKINGNVKTLFDDKEVLAEIWYNKGTIERIDSQDIILRYNENLILDETKEYFFIQVEDHRAYKNLISLQLEEAYKETGYARKAKNNLQEQIEEDFNEYPSYIIEKTILLINSWLPFKKEDKRKNMMNRKLKTLIVYNHTMREAITDRKQYIEKMLPQIREKSEEAYADAKELINIQSEIINIHNDMLNQEAEQLNICQNYINILL